MKKVYMCDICNRKYFKEFQELLKEKDIELVASCIEQCSNGKLAAKTDGEVYVANDLEQLVEMVM